MRKLINFLVLPREVTNFEDKYLERMNKVGLGFFALHIPAFAVIALLNNTGPVMALALTSLVFLGPLLALKVLSSRRMVSVIMGVSAMFMGGLLVYFGQGPVQIEMHFYFFVLLALLAVFANPMVVVAAAVTASAHHSVLWLLLPDSVFNYEAPLWVVAVHAAFVVLESVAACFIARSFFDNVIGLEKKVEERTAALEVRNRDMRMLLGVVDQGFFTIDSQGRMGEERSAMVDRWLESPETGVRFCDCLAKWDKKAADWIDMGVPEVFDGFLPPEVSADQLPKRVGIGEMTLEVEYKPVLGDNGVESVAVILSDITAQIERERLESELREMMAIFERLSTDRSGVLEFFAEADTIVKSLEDPESLDLALAKRMVHTLKGNSSIFGLTSVAEQCHGMEDLIDTEQRMPEAEAWEELQRRWETVRSHIHKLAGERDDSGQLHLVEEDITALLRDILDGAPMDDIARRVASWQLEPTETRLNRIAERTRQLAARLGKDGIDVKVNGGDLRMESEHWAPFWSSFVHVIRNAVDHGLETSEERQEAGKSEHGTLEIGTRADGQSFVIYLKDDGRGINWDRIREKARGANLPSETEADLIEALFTDGVSTAASVSDTSGRGVGMAAVRAAAQEMGGAVAVQTQAGHGTTFEFVFPIENVAKDAVAMLSDRGVAQPGQVITSRKRNAA